MSAGEYNIGLLSKEKLSCFLMDLVSTSASAANPACGQGPVISDLTFCEAVLSFLFSASDASATEILVVLHRAANSLLQNWSCALSQRDALRCRGA